MEQRLGQAKIATKKINALKHEPSLNSSVNPYIPIFKLRLAKELQFYPHSKKKQ